MAEDKTELVFVYGTLRRHASNAFRMKGGVWEGMGTLNGRLYQISWYPGIVLSHDGGKVMGELWSVGPRKLRELDEFEGVPEGSTEGQEYRRVQVMIDPLPVVAHAAEWECAEGARKPRRAWVWEWKGTPDETMEVATGDWLDVETPKGKPLFTTIGCLSVVSFTIGTQALITMVVALFPGAQRALTESNWIGFLSLGVAIVVGGYSLRKAVCRRESGHAFQMMTGMALTLLGMIVLIRLLITFMTKVAA